MGEEVMLDSFVGREKKIPWIYLYGLSEMDTSSSVTLFHSAS